jgi:hypothetical protein
MGNPHQDLDAGGLDVSGHRVILTTCPHPDPAMPNLEGQLNALPVSVPARAFLLSVVRQRAWMRTAEAQARFLGLKNRDALRSLLLSLNLPQWRTLRRWFRVYSIVSEVEQGSSFARVALAAGHNPSSVYRSLEGMLRLKPGAILRAGGTALLLPELVRELDRIHRSLEPGGIANFA